MLDQLDAAEAAAQTVLSSPLAVPLYVLWSRAGLGLLAVLRGDAAAAAEQYEALELCQGSMLLAKSSDHVLGLLAHTMGNLDKAAVHFENALAFCRKAGYRPELAWSLCDYADLLLQRANTSAGARHSSPLYAGDRQKAMSLLEEVRCISTELAMRPLTERVVQFQVQVSSRRTAPDTYPAGLTKREVQVLVLIAKGKTNREMAADLVLSQRTVQRHISNICAKVNARNRAEATTFFLTQLSNSP